MKHLKKYQLFESKTDIESDLNDILLDIKDIQSDSEWFYDIDGNYVSDLFEVYISLGNQEIELFANYDDEESPDYRAQRIPQELIDTIKRVIYYMNDLGWTETILFATEFSQDPNEDEIDVITIGDLSTNDWFQENQSIRIKFRKK